MLCFIETKPFGWPGWRVIIDNAVPVHMRSTREKAVGDGDRSTNDGHQAALLHCKRLSSSPCVGAMQLNATGAVAASVAESRGS